MKHSHTIGEAAAASGVSAKMIRHYEKIGLIEAADRTDAGYRLYTPADIHTLLDLWKDSARASKDVRRVADGHLSALRSKAAEIHSMIDALEHLFENCTNDERPDCPILKDLADDANPARAKDVGHKFGFERVC